MKKTALLIFISSFLFIAGCGKSASLDLESVSLEVEPCIATFTEDYAVLDSWGDEEFIANAGESYILKNFYDGTRADMYYLVKKGAYEFSVEAEAIYTNTFPVKSNCGSRTDTYLGVFSDVVVYSDKEHTKEVCSLTKGRSAKVTGTTGYSWVISSFLSGDSVYKVYLNRFSSECGGLEYGYVIAPDATVFGTSTNLIPILSYIAPR